MLRWISLVCRSFGPALAGLFWAIKSQRNVQVHAIASVAVVVAGIGFGITSSEWCAVILATGLVWAAELLNTAIEALSDRVSTAKEEAIRRVKDVAAAAVLMSALAASAVGLMVFFPRVRALF